MVTAVPFHNSFLPTSCTTVSCQRLALQFLANVLHYSFLPTSCTAVSWKRLAQQFLENVLHNSFLPTSCTTVSCQRLALQFLANVLHNSFLPTSYTTVSCQRLALQFLANVLHNSFMPTSCSRRKKEQWVRKRLKGKKNKNGMKYSSSAFLSQAFTFLSILSTTTDWFASVQKLDQFKSVWVFPIIALQKEKNLPLAQASATKFNHEIHEILSIGLQQDKNAFKGGIVDQ